MKKSIRFVLILVCMTSLCGCTKKNLPLEKYSKSFFVAFDTITTVIGYDTDAESFREKSQELEDLLMEYHKLYDIYHTYDGMNNLKTINDNAGKAPVKVDDRILDMLELGVEMYQLTDGKTNIAMGSVLRIWHDHREQAENDPDAATLPTQEELERAAEHIDINNLIIDRDAGTVYLADEEMSLDVGAVAKGYATDCLAEYCKENGWDKLILSVGGNIKTIGMKPENQKWKVGIQTPDATWGKDYFCLLELSDMSLVTSGSYQRYFTVDGVNYHHIIDPDTLWPEMRFLSVSIVCESSAMGDALSTALFNMTEEEGQALIDRIPNTEAVWVDEKGEYVYTEGVEELFSE